MAKISAKITLDLQVNITLNESELKALDAIANYDVDSFLKVFYQYLGKSYLEPHENGLRNLFVRIRELSPNVDMMTAVRKAAAEAVAKYGVS